MSDYRRSKCSKCGLRCDRADGHMGAGECRDALKAEVERLRVALEAQGRYSHDVSAALRRAREAMRKVDARLALDDDDAYALKPDTADALNGARCACQLALRAADEVLGE